MIATMFFGSSRIRSQISKPTLQSFGVNVMAINLTSIIAQNLTPEVVAQIASFLGIDKNLAQRAASAAIPTILAGLSDLVDNPAGAGKLSKLVSQQQSGSFADVLRKGDTQGLAQAGSSMLSGSFGDRTMETMAQAVGKFGGTGDIGGKSLLGVLAPMVLGALGQHQRDTGLDANGLASLLRSQKGQIVAAIPSGLADQLGAAGLIDKAEAGVRGGMAAASAAGSRIASASERAGASAGQGVARPWPYWLAALAVVAGVAWYAMGRQGPSTVVEQPAPARPATAQTSPAPSTTGTVGRATADLTVDGVNLANQFNSSLNTLTSTLSGITDADGAQAALPKINELRAQLDDIKTRAAKLSPNGRSELARLIAAATPAIDQMCSKVLAVPGVGAVMKPTVDDLRARLDALARA
jgi:Bacterial protein of unknown function (DUF937)